MAFVSRPEHAGKVIPGLDVREATTEEVLEAFSEWEPEALELLRVGYGSS